MKVVHIGISGIVLVSLIGCSSAGLGSKRVDYRSGAAQAPTLEMPPDLTAPASDERYRVPQGDGENVATFSDYSKGDTVAEPKRASAVLPQTKEVRLERDGMKRWLVVADKPENVWLAVKSFLQQNGLDIQSEDQAAGVMETVWAENRARIPQGAIRNVIGKVFDNAYSSGERDQYLIRLERSKDGVSTEVYITHRGMEEVLSADKNTSTWQPRPGDPELEAIMLQRLMARYGSSETRPTAAAETAMTTTGSMGMADVSEPTGAARLEEIFDGSKIIVINNTFDRSWRRAGLAIERAGLAVEDRDRARGIYFLQLPKKEKGWMDTLMFWQDDGDSGRRYRVRVKDGGTMCEVSVTDQDGATDKTSGKIIEAIYQHINE